MKFHPFSEVFPLIEGDEFASLVDDIKAHGLREKIWLYEGKILDGRNRFLACQKARVRPLYRKFIGSIESADAFVWSINAARRHLSASQLAMAAAKRATMAKGANQHAQNCAPSQAKAADDANVSRRSVQQARKVIEQGSKALQKAVESGDVSVSKAAAVIDLPKSEQLAAATTKQQKPEVTDDSWEPDEDEDERLAAAERELAASIDKVMSADDKLAAAHAEIKRQAAEIAVLKLARDGFMNGKAAITKLLKSEQRKVERLTKDLQKAEGELERLRERISIMEAA